MPHCIVSCLTLPIVSIHSAMPLPSHATANFTTGLTRRRRGSMDGCVRHVRTGTLLPPTPHIPWLFDVFALERRTHACVGLRVGCCAHARRTRFDDARLAGQHCAAARLPSVYAQTRQISRSRTLSTFTRNHTGKRKPCNPFLFIGWRRARAAPPFPACRSMTAHTCAYLRLCWLTVQRTNTTCRCGGRLPFVAFAILRFVIPRCPTWLVPTRVQPRCSGRAVARWNNQVGGPPAPAARYPPAPPTAQWWWAGRAHGDAAPTTPRWWNDVVFTHADSGNRLVGGGLTVAAPSSQYPSPPPVPFPPPHRPSLLPPPAFPCRSNRWHTFFYPPQSLLGGMNTALF